MLTWQNGRVCVWWLLVALGFLPKLRDSVKYGWSSVKIRGACSFFFPFTKCYKLMITTRQRSCRKVMFSCLSFFAGLEGSLCRALALPLPPPLLCRALPPPRHVQTWTSLYVGPCSPYIGGSQGLALETPPPPVSFIFMQFSAKIVSNNRFLSQTQKLTPLLVWEILDPPLP